MKRLLNSSILAITFFFCSVSFAQTKAINSLIQKIDNKETYIVLTKTISLRINSTAGTAILQIGKEATPSLVKVLDDQNKGIIAHFLLSKLWKETWDEQTGCIFSDDGFHEIITINGLEIYIENNELFAKLDDLKSNKERWRKICEC